MNILVIVKQTFDTEEPVVVQDGVISENGIKFILNPYDEYAVEQAIQIKEEFGGEVTVVSVGPDRVESALRTALAMGADKAVLINDPILFGDEFAISKVLASLAKQSSYDLILGGQMSVDSASAQIGPRLAQELDIPFVTSVLKLKLDEDNVVVEREMEGNEETLEVSLPALFTAQQGLNEPRYPSLPNLMKAKKKPLTHLAASDLGLSKEDIQRKTLTVEYFLPPKKAPGRVLLGSLHEQVQELVSLLQPIVR